MADSVGPKMIGEMEDSQWDQITKVGSKWYLQLYQGRIIENGQRCQYRQYGVNYRFVEGSNRSGLLCQQVWYLLSFLLLLEGLHAKGLPSTGSSA